MGGQRSINKIYTMTSTDQERLKSLEENLFKVFSLPRDAVTWLLSLYSAFQFFDDLADGDDVPRDVVNEQLFALLIEVPLNPFFDRHKTLLASVVTCQVLKWHGSDARERRGKADAKSYMWRAGYYDIVLFVCQVVHGYQKTVEIADTVMDLYGETYEDYIKEMEGRQCLIQ